MLTKTLLKNGKELRLQNMKGWKNGKDNGMKRKPVNQSHRRLPIPVGVERPAPEMDLNLCTTVSREDHITSTKVVPLPCCVFLRIRTGRRGKPVTRQIPTWDLSMVQTTKTLTVEVISCLGSHANEDVPCVVCDVTKRSTVLMVPGRSKCHPGWTLEYTGYLMAGYYDHAGATDYYCVDKDPENLPGGEANDNGYLLYFVEARCGSVRCPLYVNGRELMCAVCTK